MGDIFFDLANFAVNHHLDEDGRNELLDAYFGGVRPADVRALEMMRFMSLFREAMWGVVQGAVSELDFDFAAYAEEHFAAHRGDRRRAGVRGRAGRRPRRRARLPTTVRSPRQRDSVGRQRTAAAPTTSARTLNAAISLSPRMTLTLRIRGRKVTLLRVQTFMRDCERASSRLRSISSFRRR